MIDDLRVAGGEAERGPHAVDGGDGVDDGGVEAGGAPGTAIEFALAPDVDVRARVGVRQQAVERAVEGVREHERAGHEGDAEHHSEGRGQQSQLLREKLLQGELEHDDLLVVSWA
ncbi:MAG: hypothetical protein HZB15_04935 [Actinobacteria bacterium]|nr:hypothetical protein [Actinomycetota bacterium]